MWGRFFLLERSLIVRAKLGYYLYSYRFSKIGYDLLKMEPSSNDESLNLEMRIKLETQRLFRFLQKENEAHEKLRFTGKKLKPVKE